MGSAAPVTGPELTLGVPADSVVEGRPLLGQVNGEGVLLARVGEKFFAVSATCTHYSGPLAEGLQVGETIRCPWHHARFDLRTGEVASPPALNPLGCYSVEVVGTQVRVTGKKVPATRPVVSSGPRKVVIIGAGAAGHSAAETLRKEGFDGGLTLIGADPSGPYDRPNVSKDYLAGSAPEEWMPLRGDDHYREQKIDLRTGSKATALNVAAREVTLSDGTRLAFDALLLATGAEPIRLTIPGADLPHVLVLRTLADSRAIIAGAKIAKRAVVLGASFIGLEVAASLRARGLEVTVVAPEAMPLQRVLGPEVGAFIRQLHEAQGVRFRLGESAKFIDPKSVTLQSGEELPADLVVAGIGVRPSLGLAESAGLVLDRGVKVNAYLETSVPGIYAAGDIARWPDPHTGQDIRVEHWVVAQRQGRVAAMNILGRRQRYQAAPFFWSVHYDVTLNYVGHAEAWDSIQIDGSLDGRNATVRYLQGGKTLAVVTVGRDRASLKSEEEFEAAVHR